MTFNHPKRPRQYAAEIAGLPKAERAAAIARVPPDCRAITEHHLADWTSRGVLEQAAHTHVLRHQMEALNAA